MPALVLIWVWLCAYLNCAGWTLSALHQLNATGYAVALGTFFISLVFLKEKIPAQEFRQKKPFKKFFRRIRKPFPAIFFIISSLIFVGGVVYPPNNYDALTYRLPRILNWLANGQWFWISTANNRMNFSTSGWEWVATPFFALLHSDRGLFLINIFNFLLLPGLIFSVFRRLGVPQKVAWIWMWVFPLGYGFAIQAGGIGNDLAGVTFALASVDFGMRARQSNKISDIWAAGLATALMTAVKLSNLPLILPCFIAVCPALIRVFRRWFTTMAIAIMMILSSAAPTIVLNQIHTGSWNGDPENSTQIQMTDSKAAFLGNSLLLARQSLMPPILPAAGKVNKWLNQEIPESWHQMFNQKFPRYYHAGLNELPQEESAGLGLGMTLLLLVSVIAGIYRWKKSKPKVSLVGFAAWFAMLFFMTKMGSEASARLMLPYYPLVAIPILLLPAQEWILGFRAWKVFAMLCALSVLPAVILSPSRPLFPAGSCSNWLIAHYRNSTTAQRFAKVYFAYTHRNDTLFPLRNAIPSDVKQIGFIAGGNDSDYSLWRPFGERQVVYLYTGKKNITVPDNVEWVVAKRGFVAEASDKPFEEWIAQNHMEVVQSFSITTLVVWGEETWYVLHQKKN